MGNNFFYFRAQGSAPSAAPHPLGSEMSAAAELMIARDLPHGRRNSITLTSAGWRG
jgi:hypothetical protein